MQLADRGQAIHRHVEQGQRLVPPPRLGQCVGQEGAQERRVAERGVPGGAAMQSAIRSTRRPILAEAAIAQSVVSRRTGAADGGRLPEGYEVEHPQQTVSTAHRQPDRGGRREVERRLVVVIARLAAQDDASRARARRARTSCDVLGLGELPGQPDQGRLDLGGRACLAHEVGEPMQDVLAPRRPAHRLDRRAEPTGGVPDQARIERAIAALALGPPRSMSAPRSGGRGGRRVE